MSKLRAIAVYAFTLTAPAILLAQDSEPAENPLVTLLYTWAFNARQK
jgi:hypothetical protein